MGQIAGEVRYDALDKILAPAIYYADNGYPVTEIIGGAWQGSAKSLATNKGAKDTYLPDGRAPKVGEIFRNRDLAGSLRLVAAHGRDGFYKGPTAQALIKEGKEDGVEWTAADLADFQPEWVEPISTTYRGWTVTELPPNGQGMAALEMLNMMEKFPMGEYGHNSVKALHIMIEAKKLAYSDLLKYVGDPRYSKAPVTELLSKDVATKRAKLINTEHATCSVVPTELAWLANMPSADTIYMSAMDSKDGNMVSVDPEQLWRLRIRSGRARYRLHTAESRRTVPRLNAAIPMLFLAPHFKRPLHTIITWRSCRKTILASPSGSWGAGISRRLTRNSCPTSLIMG